MPGDTPLVELNKIGLTREFNLLPPDVSNMADGRDMNDNSFLERDEEDNIAIDMNEAENDSNMDHFGTHKADELVNNTIFEEDKKILVVDKATLLLGQ